MIKLNVSITIDGCAHIAWAQNVNVENIRQKYMQRLPTPSESPQHPSLSTHQPLLTQWQEIKWKKDFCLTCSALAGAGIPLSIWVESHDVHRIGCVRNQPLQMHRAGIPWHHNLKGWKRAKLCLTATQMLARSLVSQHNSIYCKRLSPGTLEAKCASQQDLPLAHY